MSSELTTLSLRLNKLAIADIPLDCSYVNKISIYESLTQPGITGSIEFRDWQGLMELGQPILGDTIDISFGSEDRTIHPLKFTLLSIDGIQEFEDTTFNVYKLTFCSPWLVPAMSKQVSKAFKNKYIHEIIQELLVDINAPVGFIEPTKQKLEHYCSPLWTPLRSITQLLSYAVNEQRVGGYVLWTDFETGKINCATIDWILKNMGETDRPMFMKAGNWKYEGRVHAVSVEQDFDLIKFLNMGMGKTLVAALDYDRDDFYVTKENIKEYKHKHLAKKYPLPAKYLTDEYLTRSSTELYPSTENMVEEQDFHDQVDGSLFTNYTMYFSDINKVNILVNPNSDRRVGMLQRLDYPSVNEAKKDFSKQMQGMYLIRSIHHIISKSDYTQAITLASDGYHNHDKSLVEW